MINIIENFIPLGISFLISFLIYVLIDRNCFFTSKINSMLKFSNRYKPGILFSINLLFVLSVGLIQIFYKSVVSRDAFGIMVGVSTGIIVSIATRLENVMVINESNEK